MNEKIAKDLRWLVGLALARQDVCAEAWDIHVMKTVAPHDVSLVSGADAFEVVLCKGEPKAGNPCFVRVQFSVPLLRQGFESPSSVILREVAAAVTTLRGMKS